MYEVKNISRCIKKRKSVNRTSQQIDRALFDSSHFLVVELFQNLIFAEQLIIM
jgi:hypothetical protein